MQTLLEFTVGKIRRSNLYKEGETPEEIAAAAAATAEAAKTGAGAGAGAGAGGRKFSQEEVDRIVKNDKDKAKRERDQYLQELEALKQQGMTPEVLDQLNARIETLQNEGKTKEQLANEEKSKLEKKLSGEITKAVDEGKKWKSKYETYLSKTDILSAASVHKAHNGEQIYHILRPDTVVVEEMGPDNKPTGEYVTRVKFRDKDKDGNPAILDLSVTDAIKRMTEMEVHQNLFDSGGSSGLGGRNNGRSGSGNTTIPTETKSYMEQRKKNPNMLRTEGAKA